MIHLIWFTRRPRQKVGDIEIADDGVVTFSPETEADEEYRTELIHAVAQREPKPGYYLTLAEYTMGRILRLEEENYFFKTVDLGDPLPYDPEVIY